MIQKYVKKPISNDNCKEQCKSRYNRICGIGLTPSIGHCRDTLLSQKNIYGLYGVKIYLNTARGCNEVSLLEFVDYNKVATVVILKLMF